MNYIIIHTRDQLLRLEISKIVYFEADGNYTNIVMANKLKAVVAFSLSTMERFLAERLMGQASTFMRVGRRFIINRKYIFEVSLTKQCIVLSDYTKFAFQLPVSKETIKKIKELIVKADT